MTKIDGRAVETKDQNPDHIKEVAGVRKIYKIDYPVITDNSIDIQKVVNALEDIRVIYALMKGGINFNGFYYKGFIYRYFFNNGGYYRNNPVQGGRVPKNDKAFMKRELWGKKPNCGKNLDSNINSEDRDKNSSLYDNSDYRYVRAMLGVPDGIEFRDIKRRGTVGIKAKNTSIKRVPSPIVFKILPNASYMLPQEIFVSDVCGEEFVFSNGKNNRSKSIKAPDTFDLIDFLDCFMEDFNNKEVHDGLEMGLKDANHSDFKRIKESTFKISDH